MAITISGENNNDRILASDGVIDQLSGINIAGIVTATTFYGNLIGNVTGNLTGNVNSTSPLLLQTGGSERFRITGNNELGIAGANYGTSGQVLTSGGSGSAVSWTTIPTQVNISNNSNNRVITGGGGINLVGESNLTFDGNTLFASGNITAASDGNRATQGNVALVVRHSTNAAMRANHFIHDDFPSGSGTYYIQVTESGVTNDRNLALQGYGGKVKIGSGGVEPVETLDVSGNVKATSINLANSIFHTGDTDTLMSFSTDTIKFETAGSEAFRIDSGGRVKIGTTSSKPAADNEAGIVFGDNTAGTVKKGVASFCADGAAPLLLTRRVSDGNVLGIADDAGTKGLLRVTSNDLVITAIEELRFSTGAGHSEKMRLTNAGRLGIGLSGPSSALHVKSSSGTQAVFESTGSDNASIQFQDSNTTDSIIIGALNNDLQVRCDPGNIVFKVSNNNEKLRIDSNGRLIFGHTTALQKFHGPYGTNKRNPRIQINGVNVTQASMSLTSWDNNVVGYYGPAIFLAKSGSSTIGTNSRVSNLNSILGSIIFSGDDGDEFIKAAMIQAAVDTSTGGNDMPGRLMFLTTPDGAQEPVERLRIKNNGQIKFATSNSSTDYLEYGSNPRLWLRCPSNMNGLRIDASTTPLQIRNSDATGRSISVGGAPNSDMSLSGDYSLSSGQYDSSPTLFFNATRHNGSTTVTSFQTSIKAVASSNTNNDGYLGLGASASPDDLAITTGGSVFVRGQSTVPVNQAESGHYNNTGYAAGHALGLMVKRSICVSDADTKGVGGIFLSHTRNVACNGTTYNMMTLMNREGTFVGDVYVGFSVGGAGVVRHYKFTCLYSASTITSIDNASRGGKSETISANISSSNDAHFFQVTPNMSTNETARVSMTIVGAACGRNDGAGGDYYTVNYN